MKKIIINLIIFLALLAIVNAEIGNEDFSAISQNKVLSVCSCSISEDIINIKNTGQEASTYSITSEDWITFYPDSLILSPGQEASLNSYIKPPCDVKGNFYVKTTITTGKGLKKQFTQQVSVQKCVNHILELKSSDDTGCPCSLLFYEFQITNTGSFSELYRLEIEKPYAEWATLTSDKIGLGPGEKSRFFLYITTPCNSFGSHEISLKISLDSSQLTARYPLKINMLSCFDYDLKLGEYILKNETFAFKENPSSIYNLCEEELKIVPILIENKADISNTYYLTLYGERWAYLESDKLELSKNQQGIINLVLNPKKTENKGYSFLLGIKALNGGIEKEKQFIVNLEKCYLPYITSEKTVKIDYPETKIPVSIENKGNKIASYSFFIEGEEWVRVEPSYLIIGPNGNATIQLYASPSQDVRQGRYKTVLNVFVNESKKYYPHYITLKLKKPGMFSKVFEAAKNEIVYLFGLIKLYIEYFLGGIALLIVLIIVISLIRKSVKRLPQKIKEEAKLEEAEVIKAKKKAEKEVKKKVKEEEEEEIKPGFGKIIPYLLAVAILGALIFLGIRYKKVFVSIFSLIKAYLLYIIIGFVSLVVLITFLNLIKPKEIEVKEKEEKLEKKVRVEKKAKKEKKEKAEEEKKPWSKIISYAIVLVIIGLLIFFSIKYQEILKSALGKAATILNNVKERINSNISSNITNKLITPLKVLVNRLYSYLKIYYLYIILGFAALFAIVLIINILRKKWKAIRQSLKNTRKTFKRGFVKTKRLAVKTNRAVKKKRVKKQLRNVLLVILILSIISLAGYYSAKNAPYIISMLKNISIKKNITEELPIIIPVEEKGIKTQVWNEDRTHTIDLSKYFHDPDTDPLFYSSTPLKNITITIDNRTGAAKLKPNKDWHGKAFVIFTADDKKGGIVSSNIVTLIVKDAPESFIADISGYLESRISNSREFILNQTRQIKDYFLLYINYIALGLAILLILILFFRFRKQIQEFLEEEFSEEKPKRKNRK